jgi:hypothetical protein
VIKYLLCAVLLLAFIELSQAAEPRCEATPLSHREAELLVLSVPDAFVARKMGGRVFAVEYQPPHPKHAFYYFMLLSTVSTLTTPLDNGMLGYFSVDKMTGRVVNVAGENTVGKDLAKLQGRLRARHCVGHDSVLKNRTAEP